MDPVARNACRGADRRIALYSSLLEGRIEACAEGELLAVFPDALVPSVSRDRLRRLPIDILQQSTIYAMKRKTVAFGHRCFADLFITEVRATLSPPVSCGGAASTCAHCAVDIEARAL